jgi:predicted RNA-binding Zn-ribbon protein involved in translation (DUF1610 family)
VEVEKKTTRCVECEAEFADSELKGANVCPRCGTDSLPCNIARDTTVRLNWHELRILTIWANNWACEKCPESSRRALAAIIRRLEAQRPSEAGWAALTLAGEIRDLQREGFDAELIAADGTVTVPRRPVN